MIALITPTGARSDQFRLCAKYMKRQTYTGEVLWVIVDDAEPVTTDIVECDFREKWEIRKIYPEPVWRKGWNTQGRNLREALKVIKEEKRIDVVFVIEDDDWYSPQYLERMMKQIEKYKVTGEICTVYYNVRFRKYYVNHNYRHISLFQLAFRPELIDIFLQHCDERFIDIGFFSHLKRLGFFDKREINMFYEGDLAIGIKGMPGRQGIGNGHRKLHPYRRQDQVSS